MDIGTIVKSAAGSLGVSDILVKAASALGVDSGKLAIIQTLKAKYTELTADGKLSKEEILTQIEALAKAQGVDTESGIISKIFDMLDGDTKPEVK